MLDIVTMNPPNPKAIGLAIDVPKQFSEVCLIPLFKRD
jgi:hypothetical protein